jgi:phospholipid-binding lipoprotein MlaA
MTGLFVDTLADPLYLYDKRFYNITKENYQTLGVKSYDILNERSHNIGEYESLKKDALVLYPFLRDLYEQRRVKLIKE